MRKNAFLIILAVLLLVVVPSADPYEQTYFNDSTTEYNITFDTTPYSNIVWVEIPRQMNITSASWNMTGYNDSALILNPSFERNTSSDVADDWTKELHGACMDGDWNVINNWATDGIQSQELDLGNSGTCSLTAGDHMGIYQNITIPLDANNLTIDMMYFDGSSGGTRYFYGKIRLNESEVWSYSQLHASGVSINHTFNVSSYRGETINLSIRIQTSYTGDLGWGLPHKIWIDNVRIDGKKYDGIPENVTIDTANNGENDYTNTTVFNTSEIVDLNATAVMDYLRYTCTDDWDTGNCTIPFNASSATAGILNLAYMNISGILEVPYPNISIVHNYTSGLNVSTTGTSNITVASDGYENLTCNITFNSENYPNENYTVPTMTGNYTFTLIDGTNTITVNCTNDMNLSTYETETFTRYIKHYTLINEETGEPYVIITENVTISVPSLGISYNFSAGEDTIYFVLNESTDVRFEIEYEGVTGVITRDFNTGLAETNETRVCIAEEQTFYEQILFAAQVVPIELKATLANCLIVQDYTKFAYSDAVMARTFTIPLMYELRYWDTDDNKILLGNLDGGIASSTSIDLVALKLREYVMNVLTEGVSISALDNLTLKFYYSNPDNNNDEIIITIRNGTTVFFTTTETDTPNNYQFNWTYGTDVNSGDLLSVDVEKFIDDESIGTITVVFYTNGLSGNLNPDVALLLSGVLVFFGLTFVAIRFVFGYFGIITMIMALAILTQAPANQYIILMETIEVIMLVFILFLMKGEYAKKSMVT